MLRPDAEHRWGPDVGTWPTWVCTVCPQFNPGLSLRCACCGQPRAMCDGMLGPAVDGPAEAAA